MSKNWNKPPWYSSYGPNDYGELFYALVRIYKPDKVVELGTKTGYSAYHMARGLKANERGSLDCYDLWEKYEYNSVPMSVVKTNLKEFQGIVNFTLRDAVGVDRLYREVDILHVDLSNHGDILQKVIPSWIEKVKKLIIIEGGSRERDRVDWMTKFKKMPIRKWLGDFSRLRADIECFTIEPFPSVTIIKK
jgi:hypothetical protein